MPAQRPTPGVLEHPSQARYLTLARALAAEISDGVLAAGDRLAGERELCRQSGMSRATVRRALGMLQAEGLIEAIGARGWFVTSNVLGEPSLLRSFTDMAHARGLQASSLTLGQGVRAATLDEADTFAISPAAEVFVLERLRRLDGAPIGIERTTIPLAFAPSIATIDFSQGSLYQALRGAGVKPSQADYELRAVAATEGQASMLECLPGTSLLLARATTYQQHGRPFELSEGVFRGDRYRFRTTLFSDAPVQSRLP